ncbi:uncharacterized protein LOC128446402 [Pleuronectes platessa]|uniref:uncharacterized protein LOC128446402 n=1 Tax=Pleuronectes platessa TaxID=8262 RepID=UPI00232A1FA8|nr:uncharacterized protein LOC128446402 [Pleuronectes platessa]
MAGSTPARLKVILGENNVEKLTLPDGIPNSLDDLLSKIKNTFGLEGNIRVQYMDPDFGNDFFNLNSTTELQDLGTIKVIQQRTNPPSISAIETTSSQSLSIESDDSFSAGSHDTVLLSSPESVSSRKQQLPAAFPLPRFSYDTELQLEKGNSEYHVSLKILTLTSRMKSDILNKLAEEIFKYKAYPEDAHFCTVAEALIKKYPCLKEPGSFNGCYGWKQRLKYKNFRTLLKLQGCPELSVNSLKSKATADAFPAKKVKRPKRAEANFFPSFPIGETLESLEKERLELLRQVVIRNNERVIADKMALTFAYRRQEIINKEPSLNDFKNRWPALFQRREINAEFQRLMAVPLEEKFMAKLDLNSSELMRVIRKKGGATRQRLAGIIQTMDQDSSADKDLDQLTMAIVVIRKLGQGGQEPPEDISIVIEGVEVLSVQLFCHLSTGEQPAKQRYLKTQSKNRPTPRGTTRQQSKLDRLQVTDKMNCQRVRGSGRLNTLWVKELTGNG